MPNPEAREIGTDAVERIDTRWTYFCWVPFFSILAVFVIGIFCNLFFIYPVRPVLGSAEFLKTTAEDLRVLIGSEVAARQRIGIASIVMLAIVLPLGGAVACVIAEVYREFRSEKSNLKMSRSEFLASLGVFVVVVGAIVVYAVRGNTFCSEKSRLYECIGTSVEGQPVVRQVIERYHSIVVSAEKFDPGDFLENTRISENCAIASATLLLLAVSFVIARGLEQREPHPDRPTMFRPLPVREIEAWFDRRMRRLNVVSMLITLLLVAGLTHLDSWMQWPAVLMGDKKLFSEVTANNYAAVTNGVLLAHAVWFSALIAAVIFPAHWILAHKCRHLARESFATEPEDATKLIGKTRVEVNIKGYVERYRGIALVLMPPIAQQVLEALN